MEIGNAVVLGINTVFLYIFSVSIIGLLVFLYIRTYIRKRKLAIRGETGEFEELSRADKQLELKLLLQQNLYLKDMFTWLDARLMENLKANRVRVTMVQEFYNEDRAGTAECPVRVRLKELSFFVDGKIQRNLISDPKVETLTADQLKLLCWGIMERCRTLIPFRVYRTKVHRTTRTFRVENDVAVRWKTDTVTKEDYTVEIE